MSESTQTNIIVVQGQRMNYCGEIGNIEYSYGFSTWKESDEFLELIAALTANMEIQWSRNEISLTTAREACEDMLDSSK